MDPSHSSRPALVSLSRADGNDRKCSIAGTPRSWAAAVTAAGYTGAEHPADSGAPTHVWPSPVHDTGLHIDPLHPRTDTFGSPESPDEQETTAGPVRVRRSFIRSWCVRRTPDLAVLAYDAGRGQQEC